MDWLKCFMEIVSEGGSISYLGSIGYPPRVPSLFYPRNDIDHRFIVSRCNETPKKFKVTIDTEHCKGCLLCVHVCNTRGGKVLKESEKKTALGGTQPVVEGDCIGCRWCERYCPDFAINVEEITDA